MTPCHHWAITYWDFSKGSKQNVLQLLIRWDCKMDSYLALHWPRTSCWFLFEEISMNNFTDVS